MTFRIPAAVLVVFLLAPSCGYRFVKPLPHCPCALEEVKNSTSEPGLDRVLEKALLEEGTFSPSRPERLFVAVTRFEEAVATVDSAGGPVRQKLRMEVSWKLQGEDPGVTLSGKETATGHYPWSEDVVQLDWNRSSAIRLLAGDAARRVLEQVEARAP